MALFAEMFKENSEYCKDGLKINDNWVMIIEANLPTMLLKCAADKQFLARTAQQGVLACAEASPITQTSQILIEGCHQKSLKLAEFSI